MMMRIMRKGKKREKGRKKGRNWEKRKKEKEGN